LPDLFQRDGFPGRNSGDKKIKLVKGLVEKFYAFGLNFSIPNLYPLTNIG
jgi:hypothetical protein